MTGFVEREPNPDRRAKYLLARHRGFSVGTARQMRDLRTTTFHRWMFYGATVTGCLRPPTNGSRDPPHPDEDKEER